MNLQTYFLFTANKIFKHHHKSFDKIFPEVRSYKWGNFVFIFQFLYLFICFPDFFALNHLVGILLRSLMIVCREFYLHWQEK